ncbi:MAG: hypothetical protein M3063_16590 [Actinomycetota bacterium]|nr:hypothetical protein [Actinomycetota bacterium]
MTFDHDSLAHGTDPPGDLHRADTVTRQQHDPGPLRQPRPNLLAASVAIGLEG